MTPEERQFVHIMEHEHGYRRVRRLSTGEWAGLAPMLFTTGVIVGLTMERYRGRYCYEAFQGAADALEKWNGVGDPSGPWIKYKGEEGERSQFERIGA